MLPEPSLKHVTRQIKAFEDDPKYHGADSTVELVFRQWPRNTVFEEILAKVVLLNRLYSTNIYDVYRVAQHILDSLAFRAPAVFSKGSRQVPVD